MKWADLAFEVLRYLLHSTPPTAHDRSVPPVTTLTAPIASSRRQPTGSRIPKKPNSTHQMQITTDFLVFFNRWLLQSCPRWRGAVLLKLLDWHPLSRSGDLQTSLQFKTTTHQCILLLRKWLVYRDMHSIGQAKCLSTTDTSCGS